MSEISEQNKQKILEIYYDPSKGFTSAQDIYKKLKMKIKFCKLENLKVKVINED